MRIVDGGAFGFPGAQVRVSEAKDTPGKVLAVKHALGWVRPWAFYFLDTFQKHAPLFIEKGYETNFAIMNLGQGSLVPFWIPFSIALVAYIEAPLADGTLTEQKRKDMAKRRKLEVAAALATPFGMVGLMYRLGIWGWDVAGEAAKAITDQILLPGAPLPLVDIIGLFETFIEPFRKFFGF